MQQDFCLAIHLGLENMSNLREFVVTAVILSPGAYGREGLGSTSLRRSAGSRESAGVSQTSVSSTRNFCLWKHPGACFWRHKTAPAGMATRTPWFWARTSLEPWSRTRCLRGASSACQPTGQSDDGGPSGQGIPRSDPSFSNTKATFLTSF